MEVWQSVAKCQGEVAVDAEPRKKDLVKVGDNGISLSWGEGSDAKWVAKGRPEYMADCIPQQVSWEEVQSEGICPGDSFLMEGSKDWCDRSGE